MEKKLYVCEICGKTTENIMKEIGWIQIDDTAMMITSGDKNKLVSYTDKISTSDMDCIDFCSIKCFLMYLYTSEETNNRQGTPRDFTSKAYDEYFKMIELIEGVQRNDKSN